MTSTKTLTTLALALAVAGAAMVGTSAVSAQHSENEGKRHGRHHSKHEYRADIHTAIGNSDYARWKELTDGQPIQEQVTSEEDFLRLVEAHELMQEGSFEEARAIFDELGIEKPFHGGHKHRHGLGLHVFLELNDDEADKLEQARELFQEGNEDDARDLIDEVRESFKARKTS